MMRCIFSQRGGDHRAAALRAVEEGLLVHFLRLMGVADEDDFGAVVAALQEQVQQHEKAFGKILLAFAHRAGHVHQAEHHRLGVRNGLRVEAVEADVDRIDIGDQPRWRSSRSNSARSAAMRCRATGLSDPASSSAISCRIASISFRWGRFSAMRRP